jgi:hypothetical protein
MGMINLVGGNLLVVQGHRRRREGVWIGGDLIRREVNSIRWERMSGRDWIDWKGIVWNGIVRKQNEIVLTENDGQDVDLICTAWNATNIHYHTHEPMSPSHHPVSTLLFLPSVLPSASSCPSPKTPSPFPEGQ